VGHLYWKALFAFSEPAQITLWGPSNLQTPALKPTYDALPASLKDPNGPPPTLSDILQLPLRSFNTGVGNPTLPVAYNFDRASRNDRVRSYVQDTWRVRSNFTVRAGIAYSYETHLFHNDLQRPAYLSALLGGNLRAPRNRIEKVLIHRWVWHGVQTRTGTQRSTLAPGFLQTRLPCTGTRANGHSSRRQAAGGLAWMEP
jgi:hypothetical protein